MEDRYDSWYTINKAAGRNAIHTHRYSTTTNRSGYSTRARANNTRYEDYYVHGEEDTLYSVSRRVLPVPAVNRVNASYSNSSLCAAAPEASPASHRPRYSEWEHTTSSDTKDTASVASEKQTTETNTNTSSGPSSVVSGSIPPPIEQGPLISSCVYMHSDIAIILDVEDSPSATADHLMRAIINSDELGLSKPIALQVFSLWMSSPLLELQLKPTHKPYEVRRAWRSLLAQYSDGSYHKQQLDEPIISLQRNVFYPQHLEEKIKDQKSLELLYEEARYNILAGRYPCEVAHYIMLGGIQARIELGPYNPQVHSTHYFREEQSKYLPPHVRKSATWTWLPISSKSSAEVRLLEQFKRIPISATNRKLMRKYLEFCWSLPFYGAAFFEGQIEQPVRGLTSLITHQDIPVIVAINSKSVYVIDNMQCTVLIGLKYEELSWDFARPSREDDPNCLPCLFLQFMVVENGARVSKILQVFSRQASLMDTLISGFVHQCKDKSGEETERNATYQMPTDTTDNQVHITLGNLTHSTANLPSLSNKLSKLTLATFDEDGHCIGQMGSWSFSY